MPNSANDADDISDKLQELGFSVVVRTDCKEKEFDSSLESFRDNLNSSDVGLFYYAGHAMQFESENYLNMIDTNFKNDIFAKHSSIALNKIIGLMSSCSNRINLIILDSCRNNPYLKELDRSTDFDGLASIHSPEGTLIAFATSPGKKAKDGIGRNGRFTEAILKHLMTPDLPVEDFFKRVRKTLRISTNGEQISWEHTSLTGDFFFNISPSRRMSDYGPNAIADSFFLLNSDNPVMEAIKGLKSHNWHIQNAALSGLSAVLNGNDIDSLFVLGRNIYQAACGSANSATNFIRTFPKHAAEMNPETQKAVIEGMLFEVFFDSKGELRRDFKTSRFEDLFELRRTPQFEPSFTQIADVLSPYQSRFHLSPLRNRSVSVDVTTTSLESGEKFINGVFLDGINILQKSSLDDNDLADGLSYPIKHEKLEQQISIALLVPTNQLTVNSDSDLSEVKLLFPADASLDREYDR